MRRLLFAVVLAAALPAAAQPVPPPPQLEPVPEPPPAVGVDNEPEVSGPTITPGAKTEEYMAPDGTRYIKVTEPNGWQYYLVEAQPGEPNGARTVTGDSGVRAPMWSVLEW